MKSAAFHKMKDHLQGIVTLCLVFRKKDLYLVITQKLIFMKSGGFCEIRQISCEIKRHSLPPALHKTEEFLLSYLIYKVFRWISWNPPDFTWNPPDFTWNPPDFERPIARNGNAYVFVRGHHRLGEETANSDWTYKDVMSSWNAWI